MELAGLRAEVAGLHHAITMLHEISTLVRSAQELEPTLYALLTGVTAGVGLGMNRAAIFLERSGTLEGAAAVGPLDEDEADRVWRSIEAEGPDLTTLYEVGLTRRKRAGPFDRIVRALSVDARGQTPLAVAFRRGRLVAAEGSDNLGGILDLPTTIAAPLRGEHRIRGVLVADRRFDGTPADAATRLVFELLGDHAGRAVEHAERFERLALEARTDPLTGLGSRRSFDERLQQQVNSALVDGPSVGLLLVDLDDFKRVNDVHGHQAGDRVLQEVGRRLLSTLRPGEGFRYGGEEFAVVLPGVRRDTLATAATRVLEAIGAEPHALGTTSLSISCSVGGAILPGRAQDLEGLVRAADEALLRAKREGKKRISLA